MYGTARATGYGYSLWEFQVYGTSSGGGTGSSCGTTNAALNKTATASSTENARHAGRGRGRRQHRHPLVQRVHRPAVAAGRPRLVQTICQVTLNWEAAYATSFQIQTSTDGTNWTSIYSTTTGTGGIQTLHRHRHRPLRPDVRHRPGHRATATRCGSSRSSPPAPAAARRRPPTPTGCTGQSNQPNFGPNVNIFDPCMSAATIQSSWTRSSTPRSEPVRHPALRRCCSSRAPTALNGQHRLLHLDPGSRPEPGRRHHQR